MWQRYKIKSKNTKNKRTFSRNKWLISVKKQIIKNIFSTFVTYKRKYQQNSKTIRK